MIEVLEFTFRDAGHYCAICFLILWIAVCAGIAIRIGIDGGAKR